MTEDPRNPKFPALDPATVEARTGTGYPDPFKPIVKGRVKRALGDALGLTNFGVNLVRLQPGAASSARHWHTRQDEFVFVLEGVATLVTEEGEQELGPGMAAGFAKGRADGHHLVNRTGSDVLYLEIGDRSEGDSATYPDIDLAVTMRDGKPRYTNKKGEPY
jgi:uncharacterized cupin superfamily protein